MRLLPFEKISRRPQQIKSVSDRRPAGPRKKQLARAKNLEAKVRSDERKYKSVVFATREQGEHKKLPLRFRQCIQRGSGNRVRGDRSRSSPKCRNRLDVVREREQRRTDENGAKITANGYRVLRLLCSRVASANEMADCRTGCEIPADARHLPRARKRQHRARRSREKYKQHADGHREHERRIELGHLPRDHSDSVFDDNLEETCGRLQQLLDAGNERHEIRRERKREPVVVSQRETRVPVSQTNTENPPKPLGVESTPNENRWSLKQEASLNVGRLPKPVNRAQRGSVLPTLGGAIAAGFLIAKYVI